MRRTGSGPFIPEVTRDGDHVVLRISVVLAPPVARYVSDHLRIVAGFCMGTAANGREDATQAALGGPQQ